jgi:very-short-patch-repair endonuclease
MVLRFTNESVYQNLSGVLDAIALIVHDLKEERKHSS